MTRHTGEVIRWDDFQGLGMIASNKGNVLVDREDINKEGYVFLLPGEKVEYRLDEISRKNNTKKRMARSVKPISGSRIDVPNGQSGLELKIDSAFIAGKVHYWDDTIGKGFITHPDGNVFAYHANIHQEGHRYLVVGQEVDYLLLVLDSKNPDFNHNRIAMCIQPGKIPETILNSRIKTPKVEKLHIGTVSVWNDSRGYGFITHPDGDIFVHHSSINSLCYKKLIPGQEVEFLYELDPSRVSKTSNGRNATYVNPKPTRK